VESIVKTGVHLTPVEPNFLKSRVREFFKPRVGMGRVSNDFKLPVLPLEEDLEFLDISSKARLDECWLGGVTRPGYSGEDFCFGREKVEVSDQQVEDWSTREDLL
jgi:hypothetical protein